MAYNKFKSVIIQYGHNDKVVSYVYDVSCRFPWYITDSDDMILMESLCEDELMTWRNSLVRHITKSISKREEHRTLLEAAFNRLRSKWEWLNN